MADDKFKAGTRGISDGSLYAPISPLTIFTDTRGPFKVYLKSQGKYVLYTREMELFTEGHKKRLNDYGVEEVYVLAAQKGEYDRYLESHIGDVMSSSVMPVEEKAVLFKEYATEAVNDALEDRLPANFRLRARQYNRIKDLVQKSIAFFKDENSLKHAAAILAGEGKLSQHSLNVFTFTVCLLAGYNLEEHDLVDAGVGAMLHDLGKTVLPRELFYSPESHLSAPDRELLRSHPVKGAALCAALPVSHTTLNIILLHHERADGKGYPAGMPGENIPLPAAACGLVNIYDNLTGSPFNPMSPFNALKYMREELRGHFNVDLYKRFVMVLSGAEIV